MDIEKIRNVLHISYDTSDDELISIMHDLCLSTGMSIDELVQECLHFRSVYILSDSLHALKEIERMYSMKYECSERLVEEREPLPVYREKLHPKNNCKKKFWFRTRSNPRMRVNKSIRQERRDRI